MINACVGPNGDVYPCQSYFESLGNILTEPWQKIWMNPLAEKLRKQRIRGRQMQRLQRTASLRWRLPPRATKQRAQLQFDSMIYL